MWPKDRPRRWSSKSFLGGFGALLEPWRYPRSNAPIFHDSYSSRGKKFLLCSLSHFLHIISFPCLQRKVTKECMHLKSSHGFVFKCNYNGCGALMCPSLTCRSQLSVKWGGKKQLVLCRLFNLKILVHIYEKFSKKC